MQVMHFAHLQSIGKHFLKLAWLRYCVWSVTLNNPQIIYHAACALGTIYAGQLCGCLLEHRPRPGQDGL